MKPLTENYRSLDPQIKRLTQETTRLSGALTNNREVGNWGEVQAVFKTPAQKISSASAAAGAAAGATWFFAAGLTLPEEPWAGNIILGGTIAAFGLT